MQIRKNQKKTAVTSWELIFAKFTSSGIFAYYSILSTSWELIFADAAFVCFHCFLFFLVFYLLLYFQFENRIDPVFSFVLYCVCIENEHNLKCCMFLKTFVGNLNLETSWEFIFVTTCRSTNYFPQIRSELATIKFS